MCRNRILIVVYVLVVVLCVSGDASAQNVDAHTKEKVRSYLEFADMQLDQGDLRHAMHGYKKVLELSPNETLGWNGLGMTYIRMGKYEDALRTFTRLTQVDPKHPGAWTNRGATHIELKKYEEAVADLTKAVELDARHRKAFEARAFAYDQLKKTELANSDRETVKQLLVYEDAERRLREKGAKTPVQDPSDN